MHRLIHTAALLAACLAPVAVNAQSVAAQEALALPRTELRHYVDAVLALVDLGEAEMAEPIIAEIVALTPSDEERVLLVDQVGAARLARLAREAPETADFVTLCLDTAQASALSPERLNGLVDALRSESEAVRLDALRELGQTGRAGVDVCLAGIASANDPKLEARLREALVLLAPISLPDILTSLTDENDAVRTQSAYALGRLAELGKLRSVGGAPSTVEAAMLVGPALLADAQGPSAAAHWSYQKITGQPITTHEGLALIDRAIDELMAGASPLSTDSEGMVQWRNSQGEPAVALARREIDLLLAARLAADRSALDPTEDHTYQAMLLALETEHLGPQPAAQSVAGLSVIEMSELLGEALDASLNRAAEACCRLLGEQGSSEALLSIRGQASPLAKALQEPNARLRLAALQAIMQINPQEPFAGSSRVAAVAEHFASAAGGSMVVVASPQQSRAGNLAGYLLAEGLQAMPVIRGSEAHEAAASEADVVAVLLDAEILAPHVRETLFRLRRTATSASVPVAVLATPGGLRDAQALAQEHGGAGARVIATTRVESQSSAASLMARLERLAAGDADAAERAARAEQSRAWLKQLAENGPAFYRVRAQHASADTKNPNQ